MRQLRAQPDPYIILEFHNNGQDFRNPVPIRFRIGDTELFGDPHDPRIQLMLPGFATFGMACLKLAKQQGRAALDLDEYTQELLFRMDGTTLLVHSTIVETTIQLQYESLFNTWKTFAIAARDTVIQHRPDMAAYQHWQLITAEPSPPLATQLTNPSWFENAHEPDHPRKPDSHS